MPVAVVAADDAPHESGIKIFPNNVAQLYQVMVWDVTKGLLLFSTECRCCLLYTYELLKVGLSGRWLRTAGFCCCFLLSSGLVNTTATTTTAVAGLSLLLMLLILLFFLATPHPKL